MLTINWSCAHPELLYTSAIRYSVIHYRGIIHVAYGLTAAAVSLRSQAGIGLQRYMLSHDQTGAGLVGDVKLHRSFEIEMPES